MSSVPVIVFSLCSLSTTKRYVRLFCSPSLPSFYLCDEGTGICDFSPPFPRSACVVPSIHTVLYCWDRFSPIIVGIMFPFSVNFLFGGAHL